MLRVRLAGNLRIEADGHDVPPPRSRRARGLLAYLAAHPGPHSRGHTPTIRGLGSLASPETFVSARFARNE